MAMWVPPEFFEEQWHIRLWRKKHFSPVSAEFTQRRVVQGHLKRIGQWPHRRGGGYATLGVAGNGDCHWEHVGSGRRPKGRGWAGSGRR